MDAAQIPQRVADPAPSLSASSVDSKVLDVDDILVEILVRLSSPTTLVRAALVCKRWFLHASNPAFLRRFRKLHPPRILGFFVHHTLGEDITHFVPMLPQPLELEVAVRHAKLVLDNYKSMRIHIVHLENDNVFYPMASNYAEAVHKLMYSDRGMTIFPQLPPCQLHLGSFCTLNELVFEEEGDSLSYFYVWIESTGQFINSTVHVYKLQDGSWCRLTSITLTNQYFMPRDARRPLLVDKKIYMASQSSILVLDLTTSGFSIIQLPQGVGQYHGAGDTMLSRVDDDSGVYLIHANKLQLDIWHHKTDNWLLVNTFCLHEMYAALRKLDHTFEVGHFSFPIVSQVGKNVEFVFLQLGWSLLYLDVKCRTLRKVYEVARDYARPLPHIHPLMMIWPPTFPALKDDQASTDAT